MAIVYAGVQGEPASPTSVPERYPGIACHRHEPSDQTGLLPRLIKKVNHKGPSQKPIKLPRYVVNNPPLNASSVA